MAKDDLDKLRTVEELEEYQKEVRGRIVELNDQHAGLPFPDPARSEYAELKEENEEIDARVNELRARLRDVESLGKKSEHAERAATFASVPKEERKNEDIYDLSSVRMDPGNPDVARNSFRDRAMRAVEVATFPEDVISREDAQHRVASLLERDTDDGHIARRILNTGSPTYKRGFGKALSGKPLSGEEQRALSLAVGAGGYAVPFTLDPTILLSSNGVVNPFRQLARTIQITGDEWRGVSSAGVTASYVAEATEAADNAPVMTQPVISTERAQAFIPFSIEIGQDWAGLQNEMATLFADAKDTLEASKFAVGSGTNEPFGVVTGVTNTVNAGAAGAFTLANLYALFEALPPRYRPRAAFAGNLSILNKVRQFETTGGSASAVWQDGLQAGVPNRLMGKEVYEASSLSGVTTTGSKFLIYGDFSKFVIVDRVGMNVETISHLLGVNRRPTGERGLYAYWRNGSKVVDSNAFRSLIGMV